MSKNWPISPILKVLSVEKGWRFILIICTMEPKKIQSFLLKEEYEQYDKLIKQERNIAIKYIICYDEKRQRGE